MDIQCTLTAVFEQVGFEYLAYIEEMPGVNAQGATVDEAKENLLEALKLLMDARREMARQEQEGRNVVREEIRMIAQ